MLLLEGHRFCDVLDAQKCVPPCKLAGLHPAQGKTIVGRFP